MFRIDFDLDAYKGAMRELAETQIPFAIALTLTRTARDARQALARNLAGEFTVRNTYTARRLRFEMATKTNFVARVGHLDDYMERQAEGGTKTPRKTTIAIPTKALRARAPGGITSRKFWPSSLLRSKTAFMRPLAAGGSGIFSVAKGDEEPELLYVLRKSVKVPVRWPFRRTVEDMTDDRIKANAQKALRFAVNTARRKAGAT